MSSIVLGILFTLAPGLTLVSASPTPQDAAQDPAAEDVEIMRRLLVEAVDEAGSNAMSTWLPNTPLVLNDNELSVGDGVTLSTVFSAGGSVTHSRGFRAPGVGALFTLDVQVPAVEANTPGPPEEQQEVRDDAWERVKRDVQTGQKEAEKDDPLVGSFTRKSALLVDTFANVHQRRWTLDPEAIEAALDAVLETLASHGGRIRAMQSGEPITVALHLTPASQVTTLTSRGGITLRSGGTDALASPWANWVDLYGADNAPAQRIVVQVPFSKLQTINGGGLDELKRSAAIHRY